jgi:hypothetical protein
MGDADEGVPDWVSPCSCKGSTQWAHQSCLLSWVDIQLRNRSFDRLVPSLELPVTLVENGEGAGGGPHEGSPPFPSLPSSFLSSGRAPYILLLDDSVRCPQCRDQYRILQPRSSLSTVLAEGFNRHGTRLLMLLTAGGLVTAGYVLLWSHGFASLVAFFGPDDALSLLFTGHLGRAHLLLEGPPTAEDLTLRTALFFFGGLPLIPVGLVLTGASSGDSPRDQQDDQTAARRRRRRRQQDASNIALLTLATYLFVPFRLPRSAAWLIPLAWTAYRYARRAVLTALVRSVIRARPVRHLSDEASSPLEPPSSLTSSVSSLFHLDILDDSDEDDEEFDDEDGDNHIHIDVAPPDGHEGDPGDEDDLEDGGIGPVAALSFHTSLSRLAKSLLFPFVAAYAGSLLRLSARLLSLSSSFLSSSTFLPFFFLRPIQSTSDWILRLPVWRRSLLGGLALLLVSDLATLQLRLDRLRLKASRRILDQRQLASVRFV